MLDQRQIGVDDEITKLGIYYQGVKRFKIEFFLLLLLLMLYSFIFFLLKMFNYRVNDIKNELLFICILMKFDFELTI